MPVQVTIRATSPGGGTGAPELAAVRLASLLHGHWVVELDEVTADRAILRLTARGPVATAGSAAAAVDAALAQPELRGWDRVLG